MNISAADLIAQAARARADWPFIEEAERRHDLPPYLLYAVGSRETNLTNEVGDYGHGRGIWQLDDRSHSIPADWMDNVEEQAEVAAQMLADGFKRCGSWEGSCNAYNSGSCQTSHTTGHDYGPDVMERRQVLEDHFGGAAVDQREQTLANAESQLGYRESGTNVNRFTEWMGGNDAEWCAAFACWCAYQAGVRFPADSQFGEKGWEFVPYMATYFRSIGRYDSSPERGDFGIIANEVHVTLVESVDADGVHTIEGNESDSVMHMTRPLNAFEGFCHLPYEGDEPVTDAEIDRIAERVRALLFDPQAGEDPLIEKAVDTQLNLHGLAKSETGSAFPAKWADDIVERASRVQ